ncbi:galactose-1-phosphate uridylyltransferase, partial [Candidatus Bipolaricaulota bacterium]|nr:galactose-1-phosphate uridylyltransferase [Candidatus Bipolaricaulota bacterium]
MPELRRGPTTDRWVIVAPERARRPSDFAQKGSKLSEQPPASCPFCSGNEHMTPGEIYRHPGAGNGSWKVRVVPNKFPALQEYEDLGREAIAGFFDRMNGVGAHEVVIETPEHCQQIQDLPLREVEWIVETYIQRLTDLLKNPRFRYVLLFKNHGKEA